MKNLTLNAGNHSYFFDNGFSPKSEDNEFNRLSSKLPELPFESRETLEIVARHLYSEGFTYREGYATIEDVVVSKGGSCLGLSALVTAILLKKKKSPECKILIRPYDAVNEADKKLFAELMSGEYFDYEQPKIPKIKDQPRIENRVNRFVPLGHPIVVLDGVPLETTLMFEEDQIPFVEFLAETTGSHGPEILLSYLFSDHAKILLRSLQACKVIPQTTLREFGNTILHSLEIFPDNRDALMLKWQYACFIQDEKLQTEAKEHLLRLGPVDSDMSYKLWIATGDVRYLDTTLEQFPEHILAFLDRKVFLEPDPKEARMNLAVALWCIAYSNVLDLQVFYKDLQIRAKLRELFPTTKKGVKNK